jgi:hypothetical protein
VYVLAILLSGCIFDTREPNPPDPGGEPAIPLDDPLAPFEAMTVALETLKDANYERAISESFVFSPLEQDSLDQTFAGTDVYANWNRTVELDVLALLISDAQFIDVQFNPTAEGGTTTFQRFRVNYSLRIVNRGAPTDTSMYEGVAYIDNRNEGGNWRVVFWDEIDTVPNQQTWGYLRGILRLRLNP